MYFAVKILILLFSGSFPSLTPFSFFLFPLLLSSFFFLPRQSLSLAVLVFFFLLLKCVQTEMRNYIIYVNVSGETWRSCDLSIIIISILISFLLFILFVITILLLFISLFTGYFFIDISSRSNLYRG